MVNPAVKARWVLETKGVVGPPALALHDTAKHEGIRYLYRLLPNDPKLSGELIYKGNQKGILINTHINSPKRHTFTFAHELGHYFLEHKPEYVRDGRTGFWCTVDDVIKKKRQKEQEANAFAVELLMPEDQFRTSMAGAPFDFTLINSLAREYQVSKQTCGYRILELTQSPCAILHSELGRITMQRTSRAAHGFLRQLTHIPQATAAYSAIKQQCGQIDFTECDPEKWLARYTPLTRLYECTRGKFESGVAMTLLRWS